MTESAAPVQAVSSRTDLPEDVLLIIPVRNVVLFPGLVPPVTVARPGSVAAAQEALKSGRKIGVLP